MLALLVGWGNSSQSRKRSGPASHHLRGTSTLHPIRSWMTSSRGAADVLAGVPSSSAGSSVHETAHKDCIERTHNELDMMVLGQIRAFVNSNEVVGPSHKHSPQQRKATRAIMFLYGGRGSAGKLSLTKQLYDNHSRKALTFVLS